MRRISTVIWFLSYLLEADEGHLALLVDSWIYEIGSQFELVLITEGNAWYIHCK